MARYPFCPGQDLATAETLKEACLLIARHYHGKLGEWPYEVYARINRQLFGGELPWPHITWALTPHGKCLGYTLAAGPPVIILHPSTLGGTESENPWRLPAEWLGPAFAFDTLLHEAIHVSVAHRLGGWRGKGETSHNNDAWIAEVNRLAPLLGLHGVEAGRNRVRRVPVEGEARTRRGKLPTRVIRVKAGNVPFRAVATFPLGLRHYLGTADCFYRAGKLPI